MNLLSMQVSALVRKQVHERVARAEATGNPPIMSVLSRSDIAQRT
jgi:hypothetical protein